MKATSKTTDTKHAARKTALKIGEVSRLSGIGIEALRFYEKQGLLGRPARTESGYRLYDAAVLERLEFIKRAQVLGFSLAEIARIISHKHAGQSPCAEVRDIVRARLQEIDERIRQMRRYRKELAAALDEWEQIGDLEGHVCGLIESTTIKQALPEKRVLKRGRR
jgi:MerR family mercuric resistance operon transcriptional regulator